MVTVWFRGKNQFGQLRYKRLKLYAKTLNIKETRYLIVLNENM